jgi:hypothetical protein
MGAKHQLLAFCVLCIVLVVGPCIAFVLGGPTMAIIVAIAILILAALVKKMFIIKTPGPIRVQLLSLSILSAASASFFAPQKVVDQIILPLVSAGFQAIGLDPPESPQPWSSGLVLVAVSATVIRVVP